MDHTINSNSQKREKDLQQWYALKKKNTTQGQIHRLHIIPYTAHHNYTITLTVLYCSYSIARQGKQQCLCTDTLVYIPFRVQITCKHLPVTLIHTILQELPHYKIEVLIQSFKIIQHVNLRLLKRIWRYRSSIVLHCTGLILASVELTQ